MDTCDRCFHVAENDLGHWCLRWHRYVFPKGGEGKNCREFLDRQSFAPVYRKAVKRLWGEK